MPALALDAAVGELGIQVGMLRAGNVRLLPGREFPMDEEARAAVRARHVGFVFQTFQLLPNLTALENVMLPLELRGTAQARELAEAALGRVGLALS